MISINRFSRTLDQYLPAELEDPSEKGGAEGDLGGEEEMGIIDGLCLAVEDGKNYGYDLSKPHRFFFVEKFYETDFKKITPYAPMGSRTFDLTQILETDSIPDTERIAEILKEKTWG